MPIPNAIFTDIGTTPDKLSENPKYEINHGKFSFIHVPIPIISV